MTSFLMPSLGADMDEAKLVAWHIKPGDQVARGQVVAEVDTAKGVIELESFQTGVVEQLVASEGQTYAVGAVLAVLSGAEEVSPDAVHAEVPAVPQMPSPSSPQSPASIDARRDVGPVPKPVPDPSRGSRRKVTPLARRRAAELGIDLDRVQPTGASGEISVEDVERHARPQTVPHGDATSAGATDAGQESRNRLRDAIAAAMSKSKREIPHYYLQTPIDMTRVTEWLQKENVKRPIDQRILPIAVSLKAMALALREVPELNGHWIDGQFRASSAIHIGFAVALKGGGLVTPAIHDVDQKSLDDMMATLHELIPRARTGPLRSSEMSDGTITLTNLGDLGVQSVWGVIYPPQVAIVGLGKIAAQPWAEDGAIDVRPVMVATLAADHRASDGLRGGKFLEVFSRHLQAPERL